MCLLVMKLHWLSWTYSQVNIHRDMKWAELYVQQQLGISIGVLFYNVFSVWFPSSMETNREKNIFGKRAWKKERSRRTLSFLPIHVKLWTGVFGMFCVHIYMSISMRKILGLLTLNLNASVMSVSVLAYLVPWVSCSITPVQAESLTFWLNCTQHWWCLLTTTIINNNRICST